MKGMVLGICGGLIILASGCRHNPPSATSQYSYTYDVDFPLQPVETVVYTPAATAPVTVAATTPIPVEGAVISSSEPAYYQGRSSTISSSLVPGEGTVTTVTPIITETTNQVTTGIPVGNNQVLTTTPVVTRTTNLVTTPTAASPSNNSGSPTPSASSQLGIVNPASVPPASTIPGSISVDGTKTTTIIEPSADQTTLEKKTVVVEAPLKAVTNQAGSNPANIK